MASGLSKKSCIPCEGGVAPMAEKELAPMCTGLHIAWQVIDGKKLRREFQFPTFTDAIAFVQRVAAIAEHEDHHPDIEIHYKNVILELWTHSIGGLSENDFIVATNIDRIK